MLRARVTMRRDPGAIALAAALLVGCSTARVQSAPGGNHHHEVAVAWATGSATDGFHFPISCPGPQKLVLFANAKFQMSCDSAERVESTMSDVVTDEPAPDGADPSKAMNRQPLKCYLVVVPDFKTVPGVVTDMRKGIAAKRTGPLDCALIRYD
jgi:hypothetical protein